MNCPGKLYSIATALALLGSAANAQTTSLSGIVENGQGKVLADANVRLNQNQHYDITDSNGHFRLGNLEPGTYLLKVSRVGYQTCKKTVTLTTDTTRKLTITLRSHIYQSPAVVVTATRTRRDAENVPVPISVVRKKEIEESGAMRLSDVLSEQIGLTLISDHGTGVQMQGFNPEYTKIMIDGQPLIGRTAGTLDLDRISVSTIKQVEILKGPSSALWGSDALAGVVNIITQKNSEPFELNFSSRYGTNNTVDLSANLSFQTNDWQNTIFVNRNSSDGYRLQSNSIGQTVPQFQNYTAQYSTSYPLSEHIKLGISGRYYREEQTGRDYTGSSDDPTLLHSRDFEEDYSITPEIHAEILPGWSADISYYGSVFRNHSTLKYQQGDSLYEQTIYDQTYNKAELESSYRWTQKHTTTGGAGINWEWLTSGYYRGEPTFSNSYIFLQHEWEPTPKWDVIGGLRFDHHSEYASQLSPKFSAQYNLADWLHLRASTGRGYKAPEFRQLFLNWTNPTVGYSAFGVSDVRQRLEELQEQGKISELLVPMSKLGQDIKPEHSWAYDAGFDLFPAPNLQLRVNVFRNNVRDLIETAPVALKTNGQSVYTYFNLHRIYTQGIETEMRWQPVSSLNISAGYQFLDAERRIEDEKTIVSDKGEMVHQIITRYEPMFNRSKHSANFKFFYRLQPYGIESSLRVTHRGRYGYADANGNDYVNTGEYQKGYWLWDFSFTKKITEWGKIQMGINNLLDFTRQRSFPYLPGRTYYGRLILNF